MLTDPADIKCGARSKLITKVKVPSIAGVGKAHKLDATVSVDPRGEIAIHSTWGKIAVPRNPAVGDNMLCDQDRAAWAGKWHCVRI